MSSASWISSSPSWISHGLFISAGVATILSSVVSFRDSIPLDYVIVQVYVAIFGALTVLIEFKFPVVLLSFIPFYRHLTGKFIYMLFLAALAFGRLYTMQVVFGCWVCLVAIYTIMLRCAGEKVCANPVFHRPSQVFCDEEGNLRDPPERPSHQECSQTRLMNVIYIAAGLIVAASVFIDKVERIFDYGPVSIVTVIYILTFGVGMIYLEFIFPRWLYLEIPFYSYMLGRGVFLIFVGSLTMGDNALELVAGVYVVLIGFITILLRVIFAIDAAPSPIFGHGKEKDKLPLIGGRDDPNLKVSPCDIPPEKPESYGTELSPKLEETKPEAVVRTEQQF